MLDESLMLQMKERASRSSLFQAWYTLVNRPYACLTDDELMNTTMALCCKLDDVVNDYRKELLDHLAEPPSIPPGEDAILSPHQFDDEQPRSLERFHLGDDTGPEQPYLGGM